MKPFAFFLAAACSGALLLSSCNSNQSAETAAATDAATPADTAAQGAVAGHDHSQMDHGGTAAPGTPMMAAMNDMMTKMAEMKPKGNTDHDFAEMMLEHHRGAVAMADLELRDGKNATMRRLAAKIKADQQREMSELGPMAERLDTAPTNYKPQDPTDPFTGQMEASMDEMMENMPAPVANPDLNFNLLMTVHHQSAVAMAEAELAHGKDTQLKELAQQIIKAQNKEIRQLQDWRSKNAAKM